MKKRKIVVVFAVLGLLLLGAMSSGCIDPGVEEGPDRIELQPKGSPNDNESVHIRLDGDDGRMLFNMSSDDDGVFSVYVLTEDEYQEYQKNYSLGDVLPLRHGDGWEEDTRHGAENIHIRGDVYLLVQNEEEDKSHVVTYNVRWADTGQIWQTGLIGCSVLILMLVFFGVLMFKYRKWAKNKVHEWLGTGEESDSTIERDEIEDDKKDDIEKRIDVLEDEIARIRGQDDVEEELEEIQKRLEELKKE